MQTHLFHLSSLVLHFKKNIATPWHFFVPNIVSKAPNMPQSQLPFRPEITKPPHGRSAWLPSHLGGEIKFYSKPARLPVLMRISKIPGHPRYLVVPRCFLRDLHNHPVSREGAQLKSNPPDLPPVGFRISTIVSHPAVTGCSLLF